MNKRKEHFVTVDEIAVITDRSENYVRKAIGNGQLVIFDPKLHILLPCLRDSPEKLAPINLRLAKNVYTRQSVDAWAASLKGKKRSRITIIAFTQNEEKEFSYKTASAFFGVAPNTVKNAVEKGSKLSAEGIDWALKFKE